MKIFSQLIYTLKICKYLSHYSNDYLRLQGAVLGELMSLFNIMVVSVNDASFKQNKQNLQADEICSSCTPMSFFMGQYMLFFNGQFHENKYSLWSMRPIKTDSAWKMNFSFQNNPSEMSVKYLQMKNYS